MKEMFTKLPPRRAGRFFKPGKTISTWWMVAEKKGHHVLLIVTGHDIAGVTHYHPVSSSFIGAFGRRVCGLLRKLGKDVKNLRLPLSGEKYLICEEAVAREKGAREAASQQKSRALAA